MTQTTAIHKLPIDAASRVAFRRAAILRAALILRESQRDPS